MSSELGFVSGSLFAEPEGENVRVSCSVQTSRRILFGMQAACWDAMGAFIGLLRLGGAERGNYGWSKPTSCEFE
jgi:hypothetical protein